MVTCLAIFFIVLAFILVSRVEEQPCPPPNNNYEPIDEDEVTVGDMVLHDMVNTNDTYDIGVIDFND